MEILNNFASIYCFITFVLGAMFMLAFIIIATMGKTQEPRNNIRFFVVKGRDICSDNIELWIGKLDWDERVRRWKNHRFSA